MDRVLRATAASMSARFTSQESPELLAQGTRALFRTGTLFRDVPTPCYITPTIVGTVPHVTPDNLHKLPELKAQVVDFADIHPVLGFLKQKQIALRDFMQLHDMPLVLSARDYINASNPPSSKAGFAIATSKGRHTVTPDELMDAADQLQAELVVPLADEVACSFGKNRHRAAMQATLDWLDQCLASKRASHDAAVCGVIVGGADERMRRYMTEETVKRDVHALLLSGLDSCEDAAQRQVLIDAVVETAQASSTPGAATLPRVLTGIGHPLDVVSAVASGIDAIVSPFPQTVTHAHSALIFWMGSETDDERVRASERERSGSVLHLREKRFEKDFGPVLADCQCYTCRHFTRAYIHHLLNVREMLGDTLLYLHNAHHYFQFFRTMRERIASGSFLPFVEAFRAKYEERESTAPALPVPLAIAERQEKKDAEKAERIEKRVAQAAEAAAAAKAKAKAEAAAARGEECDHPLH
ncbi:hypothetical protein P43SY_002513 [Pythium insidiosum]|uniref:Queuine tRNA-ribosyltransferase accessory subunit 2 n=1 Tax=Pythium insidiosum TaxID=114742 RepID=A0AAD5MA05_PYTIN|nr:hypothetical protein P43SY_002513 [Pythium insidiosum]